MKRLVAFEQLMFGITIALGGAVVAGYPAAEPLMFAAAVLAGGAAVRQIRIDRRARRTSRWS